LNKLIIKLYLIIRKGFAEEAIFYHLETREEVTEVNIQGKMVSD
jgi:hypothetical protein